VVIERDGHIARVTHYVNDAAIVGLKTFVALEDARAWQAAHFAVGIEVNLRDAGLDVAESHRFLRPDQVAYQEAGPGIARSGVRNQEHIVGEDGDTPPSHLPSG
jgi:hypothetical protein